MSKGTGSLLEGLAALSNTILRDAVGIAQMRVQSAQIKAKADLDLKTTDYLLKIDKGEIVPDDFEVSFDEFVAGLNDYAEELSYGPAKGAVKSGIASMIPEMKLRVGLAMNKKQLALAEEDFNNALYTISNNPGLSAQQRYEQITEIINKTPFDNTWKGERLRAAKAQAGVEGIMEAAKENGYEATIQRLQQDKELPLNVKNAALDTMYKTMEANDKQAKADFEGFLDQRKGYYDPDPEGSMIAFLKGRNISSKAAEDLAVSYRNEQIQAMDAFFWRQYNNNTENLAGLMMLRQELLVEGDLTGYKGLENWSHRQDLRKKLLDATDKRIEDLKAGPSGGKEASHANRAMMDQVARNFKDGYVNPATGERVTMMDSLISLDALHVESGGENLSEYSKNRNSILGHMPEPLKLLADSLAKDYNNKGSDLNKMPLEERNRRVRDFQDALTNMAGARPNITLKEAEEWAQNYHNVWKAEEIQFIRNMEFKHGATRDTHFLLNMVRMGSMSEEGKLDAAVDIGAQGGVRISGAVNSSYNMLIGWQKDIAAQEYGIVIPLTEKVGDDGRVTFTSPDGSTYYFKFNQSARSMEDKYSLHVRDTAGNDRKIDRIHQRPTPAGVPADIQSRLDSRDEPPPPAPSGRDPALSPAPAGQRLTKPEEFSEWPGDAGLPSAPALRRELDKRTTTEDKLRYILGMYNWDSASKKWVLK
jgi:hypothetical protein